MRSSLAAGGPLIVLTLAVALAATIVERVAPASLLLPPTRPDAGRGSSDVRTEGAAAPRVLGLGGQYSYGCFSGGCCGWTEHVRLDGLDDAQAIRLVLERASPGEARA